VNHLAIDGSEVSVLGEVDLSHPFSSQAAFRLPRSRRPHVFRAQPAGYSSDLERWAPDAFPDFEIGERMAVELRDGLLRLAVVTRPQPADGSPRGSFVIAAWEADTGCVMTARAGSGIEEFARFLRRIPFTRSERGCTISLTVDASVRPPTGLKRVPGVGNLVIRPMTMRTLERLPRGNGKRVPGGELFRVRSHRETAMLVTSSALVDVEPAHGNDRPLSGAHKLRVDWKAKAR
jgi:hypothetical protein